MGARSSIMQCRGSSHTDRTSGDWRNETNGGAPRHAWRHPCVFFRRQHEKARPVRGRRRRAWHPRILGRVCRRQSPAKTRLFVSCCVYYIILYYIVLYYLLFYSIILYCILYDMEVEERREFRERGDSYDENDTWVLPAPVRLCRRLAGCNQTNETALSGQESAPNRKSQDILCSVKQTSWFY